MKINLSRVAILPTEKFPGRYIYLKFSTFDEVEMRLVYPAFVCILASACTALYAGPNDSNWVQMLRKGDSTLSDWIPKIQGQAAGQNPYHSFSYAETPDGQPRLIVTDTVNYNASTYGYGHLFYKIPYSDYIVVAQYHFPARQSYACNCNIGSWTVQNNGVMLHCQSPQSMSVGQDYPQSFEDQLLGYWSAGISNPPNSTTSNLCLVNSSADVNGQWYSDGTGHHCTQSKFHSLQYDSSTTSVKGANSTNATWPGKDIWEYSMARVLDSTSITYWVRSRADTAWDSVFNFTHPRYGQVTSTSSPGNTTPVDSGYISIQMEGTSTEFAQIEVLNLVGCMNQNDTAYRAYFVKNNPKACSGVSSIASLQSNAGNIFSFRGSRIQASSEILTVEAFDMQGVRVASWHGTGRNFIDVGELRPGLYSLRVQTRQGTAQAVYPKI